MCHQSPTMSFINKSRFVHFTVCMLYLDTISLNGPANTPREATATWGLQDSGTHDQSGECSYSQHSSLSHFPHTAATLVFSSAPEAAPLYFPVSIRHQSLSLQLQGLPAKLSKWMCRSLTGSEEEETPSPHLFTWLRTHTQPIKLFDLPLHRSSFLFII